jgi:TctA family transporter
MVFLERPISGTMIVLTAAVLCWAFYTTFRQRGRPAVEEAAPSTTQGTGS